MRKLVVLFILGLLLSVTMVVSAEEINFGEIIHYSNTEDGAWYPDTGIIYIPKVENSEAWYSSLRFVRGVKKGGVYKICINFHTTNPKAAGSIQIREDSSEYNAYAQQNVVYGESGVVEALLISNTTDNNARIVFNMGLFPATIDVDKIEFEEATFINKRELQINQFEHYSYYNHGTWNPSSSTIVSLEEGEGWMNRLSQPISVERGKILRLQISSTTSNEMNGTVFIKKSDDQYLANPVGVIWGDHDLLIEVEQTFPDAVLSLNFGKNIGSCQINSIFISEVEGYTAPPSPKVNFLIEAIKNLEQAAGIKRPE